MPLPALQHWKIANLPQENVKPQTVNTRLAHSALFLPYAIALVVDQLGTAGWHGLAGPYTLGDSDTHESTRFGDRHACIYE